MLVSDGGTFMLSVDSQDNPRGQTCKIKLVKQLVLYQSKTCVTSLSKYV